MFKTEVATIENKTSNVEQSVGVLEEKTEKWGSFRELFKLPLDLDAITLAGRRLNIGGAKLKLHEYLHLVGEHSSWSFACVF